MYDAPIGYFLTWVTYGTWLPGDLRGWVEYHRGWQLPDSVREFEAKSRMNEDACILTSDQPSKLRLPRRVFIVAGNCIR